jgi:hypothetical protein
MLLNAIEEFCNWSGMEMKIVKSCGMWVGAERDLKLPLTLVFREQQLKIVPRGDPVRYLGFFQSPDGDWKDMVRRVLEETRKACDKLELHPLNADEAANLDMAGSPHDRHTRHHNRLQTAGGAGPDITIDLQTAGGAGPVVNARAW